MSTAPQPPYGLICERSSRGPDYCPRLTPWSNRDSITSVDVFDLGFPISLNADGSDAMNKDGDYSTALAALNPDAVSAHGFGFTSTTGRGNDICAYAVRERLKPLIECHVDELVGDLGTTHSEFKYDSRLRRLGSERDVEHHAVATVMDAVWDFAACRAAKPLCRLLVDFTPEQLIERTDFQLPDRRARVRRGA